MKTPKDVTDIEASRLLEREEKQKKRLEGLEGMISDAVDAAAKSKSLTSNGGTVTLHNFNRADEQFAIEYFSKHGWKARYTPREESWYSMTCRSEGYYTIHSFELTPIGKPTK